MDNKGSVLGAGLTSAVAAVAAEAHATTAATTAATAAAAENGSNSDGSSKHGSKRFTPSRTYTQSRTAEALSNGDRVDRENGSWHKF